MQDAFAWNIGAYVLRAISAAFDGKKYPYPSEPNYIRMQRDEAAEANQAAASKFALWADAFNKTHFG